MIDLTLAWRRSFSAFLSIWFALVVFKVDFSLMLLGTKSLWIHLKVNILWFLYLEALNWSFSQSLNKHCTSIPSSCSNNWCKFLILLVESWRIVIISGTVHWFWLKTSFHPLLWTSSGLTGSWKLRWQNYQKPTGLPQGQRPYGQPKWCHLLVPMWWPRLWWWIHRGKLQDLWWKIQRAPEGPLCHSPP